MSTEAQQPLKVSGECSVDLAAAVVAGGGLQGQYTFVTQATTTSASHFTAGQIVEFGPTNPSTVGKPLGVLQNKPILTGQMCEIVVVGVTKCYVTTAGTAFASNADGVAPYAGSTGSETGTAQKVVGLPATSYTYWFVGRVFNTGPGLVGNTPAAADLTRIIINCLTPIATGA